MTKFIAALLLVLATVAHADTDADAVARARRWISAMHDHKVADAVAACTVPLTFERTQLVTAADIEHAFTASIADRDEPWRATDVKLAPISQRAAASSDTSFAKVDSTHHFVAATLTIPTSSTSWKVYSFTLAERATPSGLVIDVIGGATEAVVN